MPETADLEISLHRYDAGSYSVEMRFSHPESEADTGLGLGQAALATFDFPALDSLAHDPAAYGTALAEGLLSDPAVGKAFDQARASAGSLRVPLRLRLAIGSSAPELHRLRWETLRDPQDGSPLFTGEHLLFSRFLASRDWHPVRLRPQGELRSLLVVANPQGLEESSLAPIDVEAEKARAVQGLGDIPAASLPGEDTDDRATLENLVARLRDGYDILYLVCHGTLKDGEGWLWLEDDQGNVARVSGNDLYQRIRELETRPSLAVLVSCQSAGDSEGDALASIGPQLAETGIPAVVAMQGNLSMETAAQFMPTFFSELGRDGLIDRAISVARGQVREHFDYWMPALFMRLKSGRIWYTPGFGGESKGFAKWRSILRKIDARECTPILGHGLNESLLGSQGEIARRWAETYHYPMEPHERESLPQVAQFLTVNQYDRAPYDELADYLKGAIRTRYDADLPAELLERSARLDEMILKIGAQRRKNDPADPYRTLAGLSLPVYITSNYDNLLTAALQDSGKDPQVVLCPWNEYTENLSSVYQEEPDYHPTPERPLVYHLFGRLSEPLSVVLTEDDYFKFLIGVTRNSGLIPKDVLGALVNSALLMLGFRLDDWQFRVLFHSLLDQQGNFLMGLHPHIAAQIVPEEGRTLDPERAQEYLEKYYGDAKISLYWGTVEDFTRDFLSQSESLTF